MGANAGHKILEGPALKGHNTGICEVLARLVFRSSWF